MERKSPLCSCAIKSPGVRPQLQHMNLAASRSSAKSRPSNMRGLGGCGILHNPTHTKMFKDSQWNKALKACIHSQLLISSKALIRHIAMITTGKGTHIAMLTAYYIDNQTNECTHQRGNQQTTEQRIMSGMNSDKIVKQLRAIVPHCLA